MNDEGLIWSGIMTLCFIVCSFSNGEKDEQTCIWGSANHLQTFISGRFGKIFILSKRKKRGGVARQDKPLKFFILRKMVTLSHLMADKCSLPVPWTDKQSVSLSCPGCRTEKRKIPKVTNTFIFLNQYMELPAAGMCLSAEHVLVMQPPAVCPYRLIITASLINRTRHKELHCFSLNLSNLKNFSPELRM